MSERRQVIIDLNGGCLNGGGLETVLLKARMAGCEGAPTVDVVIKDVSTRSIPGFIEISDLVRLAAQAYADSDLSAFLYPHWKGKPSASSAIGSGEKLKEKK